MTYNADTIHPTICSYTETSYLMCRYFLEKELLETNDAAKMEEIRIQITDINIKLSHF